MPYDPSADEAAAWQKLWNEKGVDPNPADPNKPDLSVGRDLPRLDRTESEER